MVEFFHVGGWGMYPTLLLGLCFIGTAVRYAWSPEGRWVPLLISFGITTVLAGALGFVTGFINVLRYAAGHGQSSEVVMLGTAEALSTVMLALMLLVLGGILAGFGAWKLSRLAPRPARAV